ncbi:Stk1 family PASTA domain-containing Ser/Thr kinase [Lacrimispora saccharolytica]|uniref:Stk1 family PASTA domain-containing Ser/Thr kinase n=1 Tax=Lacrimispora saccharolytica TaxID=84030 RepID=UPI00265CB509|nr:Stk1 family PASTA domain-containing Ser/Thr kinase [Lacrimispora saccharolytica]MCF2656855.1 Stk1 family PASTA domain-containing Ser/Thr kinase [Lacrimispora saccharolytica]MDY4125845.1 Stk1 family PASTA domain-containing Ser/Thr kinase [Lachnospiraceae bacterium]
MIKLGMMIGDRYEILDKIGTGGMSDVYKAKDDKLGRLVAIKVLKQEFAENANFVTKFRTEAQAAAGMMHPNIVNVYDVGEEGGTHYIVMELVEGITLKKYIEKKQRLSVKEAVSIAIQVSMGIEAAHNNHIIHRDIKPQNIMISKDGKVKVTDFGIAKAVSSNTITSNVMGSVHYTSPEQARGGYSDEKSDIYSLGITLFEMITGRVPFNGETTVAIAIKHIQEPMPSPRLYVPEVPISVEQIILKCTQKSPDRRYQNMQELIDDLKRSLMTPDEDFVKIADMDEEAATRAMSDRELKQVTNRVRARDEYDEYTVRVNKQSEKKANQRNTQSKPKAKPQPQTRTPDRSSSKKKNNKKQNKDGSDKVTTIVAIIAAVLIGLIIIFVAGRAFGLFDFGKKTREEAEALPTVTATAPVGELGENELLVPDVKGKTYAEAVTTLNKEGFEVTKLEVSSDTVDKGNVVDQLPQAGTVANRGDTIEVSVSSGASSSKVHVPNLIGQDPMDATAMLIEAGLQAGKLEETTNPDPNLEGKICYQSYTADSAVDAGTVVDLKYSVGVGTVTYSYVGNVESPAVEDSDYKAGSSCTVVLSTTTGVELKRETTTTFPVSMNITGIPDCETGTVTIIYNVSVPGQTTTGEDGQIIETPAEDVERTVVRTVTFTKE